MKCLLYEVLLNLHIFLRWTYTVSRRILVRYKEAIYIYTDRVMGSYDTDKNHR